MRRACLIVAVQVALQWAACGDEKAVLVLNQRPDPNSATNSPIVYWPETRTTPRPLHIHVVRVDLQARQCEPTALIAEDPDRDGPAESQLEKPLALASRSGVAVAVNANAFDLVPPPPAGAKRKWSEHAPVDILGWAKDGTRQASAPHPTAQSFWIDASGRGQIGSLDAPVNARAAVAGFGRLVRDGSSVDHETKSIHPRTSLGLDRDGSILWLVVIDGRQPGYSEGVSTGELAAFMRELGCWNAINLDGGGSSILLLAKEGGSLSIMNRPSDMGTRPIPVMLAVQVRQ